MGRRDMTDEPFGVNLTILRDGMSIRIHAAGHRCDQRAAGVSAVQPPQGSECV
ncbi:MAG: hypothetical protein JWP64_1229 [Pseudonocardia sp.]|jgi:hypothetical protein|nr:hypothetical protein [Pseudonocardia sp.]